MHPLLYGTLEFNALPPSLPARGKFYNGSPKRAGLRGKRLNNGHKLTKRHAVTELHHQLDEFALAGLAMPAVGAGFHAGEGAAAMPQAVISAV